MDTRCVIGYEVGPSKGEKNLVLFGSNTKSNDWIKRDVRKLVGTVPIIGGIYAGVMEIKDCLKDDTLKNKGWHILRGIVQIIGLGALYTAADITVSLGRAFVYLTTDIVV